MNDSHIDENPGLSNFDTFPEMEIVKEENNLESGIESAADSEPADLEPEFTATPTKSTVSSNARRARGLSFLPVRPGSATPLSPVNPAKGSPTKSMVVLSPNLSSPELKPSIVAEKNAATPPKSSPIARLSASPQHMRRASIGIASNNPSASRPPSHLSESPIPTVDNNQHLLNSYFSELASRESRITMLREKKAALEQELAEEEFSMAKFKENGPKLAHIVSDEHEHDTVKRQHARSESTSSGNSYSSNTSSDEMPADMFDAGRRVVAAMWSSLVKNIEPEPRPVEQHTRPEPKSRPSSRNPHRSLTKKQSIAEFVRSRSQSPSKQERREHAAQQSLRSSQRLSKKLSHVNLRAPHELGSESPVHLHIPPSPSRNMDSRSAS